MKMNKFRYAIVCAGALFLTACGGGGGSSGSPASPSRTADFSAAASGSSPRVYLSKNRVEGDAVYVDVKVTGVHNLYGAAVKLDYDANKVRWHGYYQAGTVLTGGFTQSALYGGTQGSVVAGVTGTGEVNGEGVLITFSFRVVASGSSAITFDLAGSKLTDSKSPDPTILPVSSWNGGTISGS